MKDCDVRLLICGKLCEVEVLELEHLDLSRLNKCQLIGFSFLSNLQGNGFLSRPRQTFNQNLKIMSVRNLDSDSKAQKLKFVSGLSKKILIPILNF